ncbi:hypothetical protein [Clostridium sp. DL1XJH146]
MDYKVIQIISAPGEMYSIYNDSEEEIKCKIVCLGLIEYGNGEREVVPMDMSQGDGIISKIGEGLKYIEINNNQVLT